MGDTAGVPVLALNAGSSSLKFGLYLVNATGSRMLLTGNAQMGKGGPAAFEARNVDGKVLDSNPAPIREPHDAIGRIAALLSAQGMPAPAAVGHRIVHGGRLCRDHTLIDADVMRHLEGASVFAPLHVPPALALVRAAQERFAGAAQVACLDTAFHAGMPEVARTLAIPRELRDQGIERYGFHGLSCESIVRQLGSELPRRLVIAHLGHGASVTAVADGRTIDTSMGLTPSGGVIMSTRCGDIDPGVLLVLVRKFGFDTARLEALIDQRSGLVGISGISGDMRELHAACAANVDACLAIAMFCYSVRKQVAAMAAVLGGIDLLVFTGGIGENDAAVRAEIVEGLKGVGAGAAVRVMPAQEDERIAWHSWRLTSESRRVPAGSTGAHHRP